jgi:hypothetical protein
MSERYFMGVDHGSGDDHSVGIIVKVEGDRIGVLREFKIDRGAAKPIVPMPEGVFEIPGRVVGEISRIWVNEAWLRGAVMDAEYDHSPPRKTWPEPKQRRSR